MKKIAILSCVFLLGLISVAHAYYEDPTHVTNNALACEECHGGPDWTNPGAAHPNLLRNDSTAPAGAEEVCSDCHNDTGSRFSGYPGIPEVKTHKVACWDCHQNHQEAFPLGYVNLNYIKDTLSGNTVNFTDPTILVQSNGSGVCQVCHTTTSHYRADGTEPEPDHFVGQVCTDCHTHSTGFGFGDGTGCSGCHGSPPTDTNNGLASQNTGSLTTGAHDVHATPSTYEPGVGNGYGKDCTYCHQGGMTIDGAPFVLDATQIGFNIDYNDGLGVQFYDGVGTTYTGQSSVNGVNGYIGTNGTVVNPTGQVGNGSMTCSNIYCHSTGRSLIFGTDPVGESFAWDGSTLDPDGISCNNCHKEVPQSGSGTGLHYDHVTFRKFDCNYCHDATVTAADYPNAIPFIKDKSMHVNGKLDVVASSTYDTTSTSGLSNPFTYVAAPGGGTCYFPTDGTASCHSRFTKPLEAVWTTSAFDDGFCGNGIIDGLEACDDGNNNDFDTCNNACESQTLQGPATDCTDADGDAFIDIADSNNGCYILGAPETAPPYDECDNDPSTLTGTTYYRDADGDGYGDPANTQLLCSDPGAGWVLVDGDCDDTDPTIQNCGSTLYFPAIKDSSSTSNWRNFGTIQSKDTSVALDILIHAYNDNGTECADSPQFFNIPINGRQNFRPYLICDLSGTTNFEGTITVEALGIALGTINTIAPSTSAFNIYEDAKAKTSSFFPKVFDGINNWTNNLYIQNTDALPVNVTIDMFDISGSSTSSNYVIAGHGKLLLRPQTLFGGPTNGGLIITSDRAVASMMRYEYGNAQAFTIYESMEAKLAHYFPRLKERADSSWRNFLSLQNVDPAQSATCTVSVYDDFGTLLGTEGPTAIAPNNKLNTRPGRIADPLQTNVIDFDGHAIATCDLPVIGSVNTIAPNTNAFNIYESTVPGTNLYFPKILDQFNQWVSEISVTNTDATPRNISISFYDGVGALLGGTGPVSIPAFGRYNVVPSTVTGGTANGTAQVLSDNPVNTMVQYEWRLSTGLPGAFTVYEAISQ